MDKHWKGVGRVSGSGNTSVVSTSPVPHRCLSYLKSRSDWVKLRTETTEDRHTEPVYESEENTHFTPAIITTDGPTQPLPNLL